MEKEIWKDICGFEGKYQVSNKGNVYSFSSNKMISKINNGRGYLYVNLWKDNKQKREYIHRLVASAFLDNPNGLPQVNHKDEDKSNNCVENLEWCDNKYNNGFGTLAKRRAESYLNNGSNCSKVAQYTLDGEYVATFRSMREAERENSLGNGTISAYFRNGYKQCGGYIWKKI